MSDGRPAESFARRILLQAPLVPLTVMLPLAAVYMNRSAQTVLALALLAAIVGVAVHARGGAPGPLARLRATQPPAWLLLVLTLFLFALASAAWAPDRPLALERGAKLVASLALGFALFALLPPLSRPWHRNAAVVAVGVAGLVVFVEMATPGILRQPLFGNHLSAMNRSAATLALFVWPALALASGPRANVYRLFAGGAVVAAVLSSYSQSAMVGLAVGGAVFLLALASVSLARWLLLGATVVLVLAMPVLVEVMNRALPDWLIELGSVASVGIRLDIWHEVARIAAQAPLLGQGLEATRGIAIPALENGTAVNLHPFRIVHPHNGILQVWVDLGIVGVLFFTSAAVLLLLASGRIPERRRSYALAGYAAFLTVCAVSHGVWQTWWINVLTAMILVFTLREREPAGQPASDPLPTVERR